MKKTLRHPIGIELARIDHQAIIYVAIPFVCLSEWLLGLMLLKEKLINTLIIRSTVAPCSIKLYLDSGTNVVLITDRNSVQLQLSQMTLDYLIHYFLKYYRDGIAEVDHIDIEAEMEGEDAYITFTADAARPPVDASEARRRLGLADDEG